MPYINRISGGSARKFGLTRRSSFYLCGTHTAIVTLNNTDKKCYYPASYNASSSQQQQGPGCYSGGGYWGSDGVGAGCCSCAGCPYAGCVGCFGVSCTCYNASWQYIGNVGGSCYQPYYITVTVYSCPVNTGIATVSGSTCVYPAAYNATLVS